MPEHVRVDLEADLAFVTGAGEEFGKAGWRERGAALRSEEEGRGGLALELPQRPQFIAEKQKRRQLAAPWPSARVLARHELFSQPAAGRLS
jgi:hypothetical protein